MRKLLLLLLLFVFIAVGCRSFNYKPPFKVEEGAGKMVIIPFREGDNIHHFESSIGRDVAERMEDLISQYGQDGPFRVAPFTKIGKKMMEDLRNTASDEIDWAEIGKAAQADFVFSANITKFEVRRPQDRNLFKGIFKVRVFVISTADGNRLYGETHTVRHPHGDTSLPYEFGPDAAQKMRLQLIMKAAKVCAERFYPTLNEDDE